MNEIIETMMKGARDNGLTDIKYTDTLAMLRAARAEGWELCRLPEPRKYSGYVPPEDGSAAEYWEEGFESCLDEIERLQLEDES